MTVSSKTKAKVDALKTVVGDMSPKEARALAKTSKILRIKKKRGILVGQQQRVFGTLVLTGNKLQLTLPADTQVEQVGNVVNFTFSEKKKEKKVKKKVDKQEENK